MSLRFLSLFVICVERKVLNCLPRIIAYFRPVVGVNLQELRGGRFEMLANQARAYLAAKDLARRRGERFRMTFVRFKEDWFRHNAAAKM